MLRQRSCALPRSLNFIDGLAIGVLWTYSLLQFLAVANNNSEQIVKIMRHPARKPSNGLQFLGGQNLRLHLFTFRNVSIYNHQLLDFSGTIPDRASGGFQREPISILVEDAIFHSASLA